MRLRRDLGAVPREGEPLTIAWIIGGSLAAVAVLGLTAVVVYVLGYRHGVIDMEQAVACPECGGGEPERYACEACRGIGRAPSPAKESNRE